MLMQASKPAALPGPPKSRSQAMIRRFSIIGLGVVALLIFGVGGWMATAQIAGAVIGPGQIVVETSIKEIQHSTGGIVGEILVDNGDTVEAGDILLRLDDTVPRATRDIYRTQVDEMLARQARLLAEAAGADQITFDPALMERQDTGQSATLMERELELFDARKRASESKKAQLNQRVGQINEEIAGLESQLEAKKREADLIDSEVTGVRDLYEKGLVEVGRVNDLDREAARLDGENGQLVAEIARARGRVTETQLQITQFESEIRNKALNELADTQAQLAELRERLTAADDKLRRVNIPAPRDGVVHQLQVHTVGGVVGAGEVIMQIIPTADALVVDARVAPTDIDQVVVGADVRLQVHAGNQRATPEIIGKIVRVSGNLTQDQQTGQHYYEVRAEMPENAQDLLGDLTLVPGMPVTAFIQTHSRTVLEYILKPLMEQIDRAFKER